jgi:hypothetical protein
MLPVQFIWFEACVCWKTAPTITLGKCDNVYEAEQAIKEYQSLLYIG